MKLTDKQYEILSKKLQVKAEIEQQARIVSAQIDEVLQLILDGTEIKIEQIKSINHETKELVIE